MALISKNTKIEKPAYEKILEAFSYIKDIEGYEKAKSSIERWVEKNKIKSSNFIGPFLRVYNENSDFVTSIRKKNTPYKIMDDYNDDLLDSELYIYCVWDKIISKKDTNNKYTIWSANDGAFIILAVEDEKTHKKDDMFFVDKTKIDISKYKK